VLSVRLQYKILSTPYHQTLLILKPMLLLSWLVSLLEFLANLLKNFKYSLNNLALM
jgi:hypothetical protein